MFDPDETGGVVAAWNTRDPDPALSARVVETDQAEARRNAAQVLLDMLHMRNDRHAGMTKDEVRALWTEVRGLDGYSAVAAFLATLSKACAA